ncbi:bifunctional pantoate--beta-alanine ligase/(d)CMP kinase [Synechococcus sp. PCC 7336]|uniref:bifunctional pantoate--beta-alanine ligase/(d)CMP kinase n=1 Tax=Synechococcus sp. PCC 7336 TaxID=195250 RepID=UPI000349B095|nr:bifunctional pantoate--beta-alanine ligase/(d)CMP kinase [Synechococcus sp. PCC 7336]
MHLARSVADLRCQLVAERSARVGLVPTMGALHRGHLSLLDRAVGDCDITVVSIFVNPLQFSPHEDFDRYPRQLDSDLEICRNAGADIVFAPEASVMLANADPAAVTQVIPPAAMLEHLCGPWRPGHFEGVLTIVAKLLHIVQPQRAYFGQKDAQQLALIRRMVRDLDWPIAIVGCPTVREPEGLALSSRNQYLSPQERWAALALSRGLFAAQQQFAAGDRRVDTLLKTARAVYDAQLGLQVQYLELVNPETLQPIVDTIKERGLLATAAWVGQTRPIDNVMLEVPRQPILAIDGPAGAGKSTVARRLAAALNLRYLDTGALYRAVTWLVSDTGTPVTDGAAIARLAASAEIRLEAPEDVALLTRVWVNGREVTAEVRSPEITAQVSAVSALPQVRQVLLDVQQQMGRAGGVVMEGRDIGTQVFPDAELKIFLTASPQERARRRLRDLQGAGSSIQLEELEQQIRERDRKDSERAMAPLKQAADAIAVNTDGLTQDEVVEQIAELYRQLPHTSQ